LGVHWGPGEPQNAKDAALGKAAAGELPRLLHLEMVNQGIHSAPGGMYIVSVPMAEPEIDKAVEAFKTALDLLKPFVVEDFPHLLID
jgi:glutamate-1-semialdehyde aminotransferase